MQSSLLGAVFPLCSLSVLRYLPLDDDILNTGYDVVCPNVVCTAVLSSNDTNCVTDANKTVSSFVKFL